MLHYFSHLSTTTFIIFWISLLSAASLAAQSITEDPATGLTKYPGCVYLQSEWNDGDSFSVRLTNGKEITVRLYAFVETAAGASLAEMLVRKGLARAYGVYRQGPTGLHHSETEERMADMEFLAAGSREGIWAYTDWEALPDERLAERLEAIELEQAITVSREPQSVVNPNTADARTLQKLNGVGPATALKIIEAREERPFESVEDLQRVSGIGPATVKKLRDSISFD